MQLKQLLNDDDAVSPVIGVILMVAITVILAAVIGTFVLGLGDQVQDTAPNAQISEDYDSDADDVTITHQGGDGVPYDEIAVNVDGHVFAHDSSSEWDSPDTAVTNDDAWFAGSGDVTAGDQVVVAFDTVGTNELDATTQSGDEVRTLWKSGDSSSTLSTWER